MYTWAAGVSRPPPAALLDENEASAYRRFIYFKAIKCLQEAQAQTGHCERIVLRARIIN